MSKLKKIFFVIYIFSLFVLPQSSSAFSLSTLQDGLAGFFRNITNIFSQANNLAATDVAIDNSGNGEKRLGYHNVLAVIVEYNDSKTEDGKVATDDLKIRVKNYFKKMNFTTLNEFSYGKINGGVGDVIWHKFNKNYPASGSEVDWVAEHSDLQTALSLNNLNLKKYNRIVAVYLIPQPGKFDHANSAYQTAYEYNKASYTIPTLSYGRLLDSFVNIREDEGAPFDTHEYSHSFGLGHVKGFGCGSISTKEFLSITFAGGSTLPKMPYDDCKELGQSGTSFSSTNGGFLGGHPHAYEIDTMRVLNTTYNPSQTADGFYLLELRSESPTKFGVRGLKSISSQERGIKVVKVFSLDKRVKPLYIEMRDGSGFDKIGLLPEGRDLYSESIRFYDAVSSNYGGLIASIYSPGDDYYGQTIRVIDLDPTKPEKFSLSPGGNYSDQVRGVSITNIKRTAMGIDFDVELAKGDFALIKSSKVSGLWAPIFDIKSIDGPKFLNSNQEGEWRITLDEYKLPRESLLGLKYTYRVDWGDSSQVEIYLDGPELTIKHKYTKAGLFKPRVTVLFGGYGSTGNDIMSLDRYPSEKDMPQKVKELAVAVDSLVLSVNNKLPIDFKLDSNGRAAYFRLVVDNVPLCKKMVWDFGDGSPKFTTPYTVCDKSKLEKYFNPSGEFVVTYRYQSAGDFMAKVEIEGVPEINTKVAVKVKPPETFYLKSKRTTDGHVLVAWGDKDLAGNSIKYNPNISFQIYRTRDRSADDNLGDFDYMNNFAYGNSEGCKNFKSNDSCYINIKEASFLDSTADITDRGYYYFVRTVSKKDLSVTEKPCTDRIELEAICSKWTKVFISKQLSAPILEPPSNKVPEEGVAKMSWINPASGVNEIVIVRRGDIPVSSDDITKVGKVSGFSTKCVGGDSGLCVAAWYGKFYFSPGGRSTFIKDGLKKDVTYYYRLYGLDNEGVPVVMSNEFVISPRVDPISPTPTYALTPTNRNIYVPRPAPGSSAQIRITLNGRVLSGEYRLNNKVEVQLEKTSISNGSNLGVSVDYINSDCVKKVLGPSPSSNDCTVDLSVYSSTTYGDYQIMIPSVSEDGTRSTTKLYLRVQPSPYYESQKSPFVITNISPGEEKVKIDVGRTGEVLEQSSGSKLGIYYSYKPAGYDFAMYPERINDGEYIEYSDFLSLKKTFVWRVGGLPKNTKYQVKICRVFPNYEGYTDLCSDEKEVNL